MLATYQEAVRSGTNELRDHLQITVRHSTMTPSSEPSRGHRCGKKSSACVLVEENNRHLFHDVGRCNKKLLQFDIVNCNGPVTHKNNQLHVGRFCARTAGTAWLFINGSLLGN